MTAALPDPVRVLVLEDLKELADLYAQVLALQGFKVEVAHDGMTALQLMSQWAFDIALVDIDLPDLNGFEVVTRARAAGYIPKTRIVFCTGGCVEERLPKSQQFPGSYFVSKPFTMKKLLTTIADARNAT